MSTRQLINNIEALSETLSEKQLVQFLDIMDRMTNMVDEAKKVSHELVSHVEPETSVEPIENCKYLH